MFYVQTDQNEEHKGSVEGDARLSQRLENDAKAVSLKATANTAASHSLTTEATGDATAQRSAATKREELIGHAVRSAVNLCATCATSIAQNLARSPTGHGLGLTPGTGSMADHKR